MQAKPKPTRRTDLISAALRSAILERALLPGMKLPEDSLGEGFGASRALEKINASGGVPRDTRRVA